MGGAGPGHGQQRQAQQGQSVCHHVAREKSREWDSEMSGLLYLIIFPLALCSKMNHNPKRNMKRGGGKRQKKGFKQRDGDENITF